MSTHDRPPGPDNGSERTLRELFARAAPRPAPPEADAEEIRRAVYAEWDAVTGRRVFWRRAAGAAAAAAVVAGVALFVLDTSTGPLPTVATVERVQGNVEVDGVAAARRRRGGAGRASRDAQRPGLAAARDGGSLRLASQTELTLLAGTEAELDCRQRCTSIRTAAPRRRSSRCAPRSARCATSARSSSRGSIRIGSRSACATAVSRSRAERRTSRPTRVSASRCRAARAACGASRSTASATDWAWAEQLAPPFEIDGRQLIDFLDWVARETGRDARVRRRRGRAARARDGAQRLDRSRSAAASSPRS